MAATRPGSSRRTPDARTNIFIEGLPVDYYSSVWKCWAPATIIKVDQQTFAVTINTRRDPLPKELAQQRLRPRTRPGKRHLDWIASVLRDGHVEAEARKVFQRYATPEHAVEGATISEQALTAAGECIDDLLGVSGSTYELRQRADQLSEGKPLPRGWEARRASTGGQYYLCTKTDTAQWTPPASALELDVEDFVALFWELLTTVNKRWGQVFRLKEGNMKHADTMHQDYDFGEQLQRVGEGSFGTVYLATHKRTGIVRVMKKVKDESEGDDVAVEQVNNEVARLRALDHPHIVRLYDCYRKEHVLFLVMDYCSGGDLSQYVKGLRDRQQRLHEPVLASLTRQLLLAVAHVHAHGLLHLDIKPGNVVIVPETCTMSPAQGRDPGAAGAGGGASPPAPGDAQRPLHVMLIDLGLAQAFCPGERARVVGTPVTMAPEAWRGVSTPAADVFSSGCTLFFLLSTGLYPFGSPSDKKSEAKVFWSGKPKRIDLDADSEGKLPYAEAAYTLCDQMLHLQRQKRPTAAQCLQEDFLLRAWRPGQAGAAVDERMQRLAKAPGRSLLYMSVALSIASEWPAHRMPSIRKAFEELDVSGTGRLQKSQIAKTLIKLGHSADVAHKAADAMDLSRDGTIDWTEFVAACVNLGSSSLEIDLQELFRDADRDGDGFLDREDVAKLLSVENLRAEVVDDAMRLLLGAGANVKPGGGADKAGKAGAKVDWPTFRRHFASICKP